MLLSRIEAQMIEKVTDLARHLGGVIVPKYEKLGVAVLRLGRSARTGMFIVHEFSVHQGAAGGTMLTLRGGAPFETTFCRREYWLL